MIHLKTDALLFFKPYLDHGNEWFEYHPDILKYIDALRDARKRRTE